METAIDTLKKKIINMNDDIDLIQRRLDDDIGKIYEDELNPLMIIEDMENIKKELKQINNEFENIYKKKKRYISILHRQMQNYNFLSDIENKLDSETKEFEPYKKSELLLSRFFYEKIKQFLLNLNIEDLKKTLLINAQQYILDNNKMENRMVENHSNSNTYKKSDIYNNNDLQSERKDAFGKTSTNSKEQINYTEGNMEQAGVNNLPTGNKSNEHLSNESSKNGKETNKNRDTENPYLFKPIDEKTFHDVPALTRRRAKLEDVNRVYKTLYEMAIKDGCCKPIEKSELQQMNLQVFGQTGEAKLATLRYLKIIEILNKTGSVRLLHCAGIKKKKKRRGNFK